MLNPKLSLLSSSWLELVFEKRNKVYGAYAIRKNAEKDLSRALLFGSMLFLIGVFAPFIYAQLGKKDALSVTPIDDGTVVELDKIAPHKEEMKEKEVFIPKKAESRASVDQVKMLPPKVVAHDLVTDEVPSVEQLKTANPGPTTLAGDPTADIHIDAPVGERDEMGAITEGNGEDNLFVVAEVSPSFPGGMKAFMDYVSKNYQYPTAAKEQGIGGRIILSFIVERDGTLSDIQVVRDLGLGTGQEAVRILKAAPKWNPGIQNGRPVRVRFQLPIALQLNNE